jgi:hypothetical protein
MWVSQQYHVNIFRQVRVVNCLGSAVLVNLGYDQLNFVAK